ncbi:MAG: GAF domain-containing protein [Roseiflexaceae bacterium]|nr:GAF domain-containing protein [Roseiflexaceae bacterium]
MASVAAFHAASNETISKRDLLFSLVDTAPWSVVLIDPAGIIAAISPSARRILNVQAGAPASAILPADIDGSLHARFHQALACASSNTPGVPCVFQRLEPVSVEVEAVPISFDNAGWVSVTLYEPSRPAMLHQLMLTLQQRLYQLSGATSLREVCDQLSAFLLPAGVSLAVMARNSAGSSFTVRYAPPRLRTITLDERTLALALQHSLPLLISAADVSSSMALGLGARGHVAYLMPGSGQRQYILHLWGSSIAPDEEMQVSAVATLVASLLARIIEREEATRHCRLLGALSDAALEIISLRTVDKALYEICHRMMTLLQADHASIYLPTGDPNFLACVMATGVAERLRGRTLPLVGSLIGRTFREGATLFFADVEAETELYRPFWEAHQLRAALDQPLYHQGSVIGVLCAGWYHPPELNEDDYAAIRRFADLATAIVTSAQLHQTSLRSEQYYRPLFEQVEDMVFSLSVDGNILRCNRTAAARVGAAPGMSFFSLVTPACEAEVRWRLQEIGIRRQPSLPWTFEALSVQGQPIVLETTAQVIRIDLSAVEIDLICRDVTAQRAAEQEMQQLHLELTTLLRVSQTINRSTDLEHVLRTTLSIIVQAMNLYAAAIALHDADGHLWLKHSHGPSSGVELGDRPLTHMFQEEREALAGGISRIVDVKNLRMQTPDLLALRRLPDDASYLAIVPLLVDDTVIGLLELLSGQRPFEMRDMELAEAIASQLAQAIRNAQTNQEMRETSLMNARLYREAEAMRAYLDAIIQNAPDVLIVCRPDMSMQPLNQEPLTALGYQRHELAGQSLLRLVPPDHRTMLTRAWSQVRQGESQRFEMDLLRADKSRFTALVSFDLIPDYDEVLVVIKDVTELRRLEAQVRQHEKLAALGRLVAGAAHELNNPLAVILGLSQLQLGEDIPPSVRADLEQIERAARRAAAIVHQLRAFGQPRTLELAPVDLSLVIDETLQRLASKIAAEHVVVTVDLPPDLPRVLGEVHQIEQVVFNIALNAIQALALRLPGEPRHLRFSASADSDSVVLAIEDTGPGIAPEHLSRVFEPFFTTREVGQGMGMGLAVVYSIVQQHHGDVWVESTQGVGTTFRVRLRRTDETSKEHRMPPVSSIPRNLSVLLVEDDDLVRTMAQRALERLECRVDAVSRGEEALARALAYDYALVITDLQMPGLDGVELYERLNALKPSLRWLILTGDTMGQRSSAFLQRVGLPVLHKPFTHEQLIESIAVSLQ